MIKINKDDDSKLSFDGDDVILGKDWESLTVSDFKDAIDRREKAAAAIKVLYRNRVEQVEHTQVTGKGVQNIGCEGL